MAMQSNCICSDAQAEFEEGCKTGRINKMARLNSKKNIGEMLNYIFGVLI